MHANLDANEMIYDETSAKTLEIQGQEKVTTHKTNDANIFPMKKCLNY
jgi:hypothetical protein